MRLRIIDDTSPASVGGDVLFLVCCAVTFPWHGGARRGVGTADSGSRVIGGRLSSHSVCGGGRVRTRWRRGPGRALRVVGGPMGEESDEEYCSAKRVEIDDRRSVRQNQGAEDVRCERYGERRVGGRTREFPL